MIDDLQVHDFSKRVGHQHLCVERRGLIDLLFGGVGNGVAIGHLHADIGLAAGHGGVDLQGAVLVVDGVVACGQAVGAKGVGAGVSRALGAAAVGEGTAEHAVVLATDETSVVDAIAAVVGAAIVGFAGVVGGDDEIGLVDGGVMAGAGQAVVAGQAAVAAVAEAVVGGDGASPGVLAVEGAGGADREGFIADQAAQRAGADAGVGGAIVGFVAGGGAGDG